MTTYSIQEIELSTGTKYDPTGKYTDEAEALQSASDIATDVVMNLTADLGQECSVYDDVDDDILKTVEGRVGPAYGVVVNETEQLLVILCVIKSN